MRSREHPASLRVGDTVPDLMFTATDGSATLLSTFRGEAMVMVFMRHLG